MNEIHKEWLNDRPNFKTLSRWNPSLIQSVIECHPTKENKSSGFIPKIVAGNPGSGKSTFCFKFMAKLDYVLQGYTKVDDEENSYKFALDNMIYRPDDLFERVLKQRELGVPASYDRH